MHIEVKRSFGMRNGRKRIRPALYLVGRDEEGRRCKKYIKSNPVILELLGNRAPLPPGRPSAYPKEIREIFSCCGFNINGSRIVMNMKKYFLPASAVSRFAMLSKQDRIWIGSPERLLSLEKQAYSMLKRANVKGLNLTYRQCLREVMLEAAAVDTSSPVSSAGTHPKLAGNIPGP